MRTRLTVLMTLVVLCVTASLGLAEDAKPAAKPEVPAPGQLRAEMHRVMADLLEARTAENPDAEKIKELTDQLQELREKIRAAGLAGWLAAGWCPWGGPGLGYGGGFGRGRGPALAPGLGRGPAFGPGMGRGPGMRGAARGPGRGPAFGPGVGRGPGFGRGPAWGRARGPGYGAQWGVGPGYGPAPRWGAGMGRGFGPGWRLVDEDGDGICDRYEQIWGEK